MAELVWCLMGPTASGKTALACELVRQFPFEIISVDSAMIYRDMDIGTAKPSPAELARAPHHLIDIKDPTQAYSAAEFCTDVCTLIEAMQVRGKIPLLVGGTMMYFNALQKGLAELPDANESLRQRLEEEAGSKGWDFLHQQLTQIDPQAAARIHYHDTQRIQRALEVYYLTGKPMSELLQQAQKNLPYRFVNLILFPQQRQWLHERIAQRFQQMLEKGLIEEVKHLQTKWSLHEKLPAMRCVGYRQAWDYLQNRDEDQTMLYDKGVAATRQLAKRQLTWLRHWSEANYYDPQNPAFALQVVAKIKEILDNSCPG